MSLYWTASECSFAEGPFTQVDVARDTALELSEVLREPVTVYSGPSITRWNRVEEVYFEFG